MSAALLVRTLSAAALIGGLAFQPVASAVPIGDFSWGEHTEDECATGLCGSFFSVVNFSDVSFPPLGGTFGDVFVDLETTVGPSSLGLGEIVVGGSSQSLEDLFDLSILSAALSLTFSAAPGSFQLLDLDGNAVAGLTAPGSLLIDYTVDASVPEPATLLLFTAGLLGLGLGRRARQHTPATSRMKRTRSALVT